MKGYVHRVAAAMLGALVVVMVVAVTLGVVGVSVEWAISVWRRVLGG